MSLEGRAYSQEAGLLTLVEKTLRLSLTETLLSEGTSSEKRTRRLLVLLAEETCARIRSSS